MKPSFDIFQQDKRVARLAQKKRRDFSKKKLDKLHLLIRAKSGPKVNCQSDNCETITIVFRIGYPCKSSPFNLVDHTGISIENSCYDLAPDYDIPHPDIKYDAFAGGVSLGGQTREDGKSRRYVMSIKKIRTCQL